MTRVVLDTNVLVSGLGWSDLWLPGAFALLSAVVAERTTPVKATRARTALEAETVQHAIENGPRPVAASTWMAYARSVARGKNGANSDLHGRRLDIKALETWLWDATCRIRGPLDAPRFKEYILPLVFLKRLSDVFDDELSTATGGVANHTPPDARARLVDHIR